MSADFHKNWNSGVFYYAGCEFEVENRKFKMVNPIWLPNI